MPAVKHIAAARFKAGVSEQKIADWFESVGRLRDVIPGVLDYAWGRNHSPEGLSQGLTHAFVTTFASAAARDAYLAHPAHETVKASILPDVEAVVVVDFDA